MQAPADWKERLAAMEARDAAQREQLQCIAHDLASPLTPMRLQLSIWKDQGLDLAGMRLLERSIDRMQRLVEDVADLAGQGGDGLRIDAETTDLREPIDDVVNSFRQAAATRHITLSRRVEGSLISTADPVRIAQVLDNLLRNALKFTPPGGTVEVEALRVGGSIQISVTDTGRGMADHERARLFRPYSQLRLTDSQRGKGLGLFICKNIVRAHDGEIWVESDGHGKGSRFVAAFPAALVRSEAYAAAETVEPASG